MTRATGGGAQHEGPSAPPIPFTDEQLAHIELLTTIAQGVSARIAAAGVRHGLIGGTALHIG